MAESNMQVNDAISWLESQFRRLPHLPANFRKLLVKLAPIFALVFGILGILATVGVINSSQGDVANGGGYFFTGAFSLATGIVLIMAYPKLKRMQYRGWLFLFWAEILGSISAFFPPSLGAVLGLFVGLYILFEMKSSYR